MAVRKGKSGCGMVKIGGEPGIDRGMAVFTRGRKSSRHMIRDGGLLEVLHVTGHAGGRESLVLADSGALVTCVALHDRVRPEKWKSVEVLLNRLAC